MVSHRPHDQTVVLLRTVRVSVRWEVPSTLLVLSAGHTEDDLAIAPPGTRHLVRTSLATAGDHLAFATKPADQEGQAYDLVGLPITGRQVAERLGLTHPVIGLDEYRQVLADTPRLLPLQAPRWPPSPLPMVARWRCRLVQVLVNDKAERRRGAQLQPGDVVTVAGRHVRAVTASTR